MHAGDFYMLFQTNAIGLDFKACPTSRIETSKGQALKRTKRPANYAITLYISRKEDAKSGSREKYGR
jgi:hypothetical protein